MNYKDLHIYQRNIINAVSKKKKIALWLSMGLGKTIITLSSIIKIKPKKVLIISPLNVAKNVWHSEALKWDHTKHIKFSLILGSVLNRKKALECIADVYVINRENVKWLVEHVKVWNFDMLVIDESTSFKSFKSLRFKSLRKVTKLSEYQIQLTGTPLPNGIMDLWTQLYLLDQGLRLEKTITAYREKYFDTDYTGFIYKPKKDAYKLVYKKIKDVVYKLDEKTSGISLPRKVEVNRYINMQKDQLKLYNNFKKTQLLNLNDVDITALTAVALCNKLSQQSNGFIYDNDNNVHRLNKDKFNELMSLIDDNPSENMLIAYKFKEDLQILRQIVGSEVINGSAEQINRWNNKEIKYLLAHPQSAGHGLNLQKGGSTIVWYGLDYSLELKQQFDARIARQGGSNIVKVFNIINKYTIDEVIIDSLQNKSNNQKQLLDCLKSHLKH